MYVFWEKHDYRVSANQWTCSFTVNRESGKGNRKQGKGLEGVRGKEQDGKKDRKVWEGGNRERWGGKEQGLGMEKGAEGVRKRGQEGVKWGGGEEAGWDIKGWSGGEGVKGREQEAGRGWGGRTGYFLLA